MAKILGQSGRYVSDEVLRQRRRIMVTVWLTIGLLGVAEGVVLSTYIPLSWLHGWGKLAMLLVLFFGVWRLDKWSSKRLAAIERKRDNMLRGATGEIQVGIMLTKLTDDFCVINDLATPSGNIDHVVVGPTGVFILDTKAWRGVVEADGKGELLLNGKPTEKAFIRQFVGRMMGVREKVIALAPGTDERFHAMFVFTAARVEARWGKTGQLNCLTDEQLCDYISDKDFGTKLGSEAVSRIAHAFLGLAHMDKEFGRESSAQAQEARTELH